MLRRHLGMPALIGIGGLLVSLLAFAPAITASAAPAGTTGSASPAWQTRICRGTAKQPGTLAGLYLNAIVDGVCIVNRGPALIQDDLIITRNSAVVAVFGRRHSRIWVGNNILVRPGGSVIMGCEPKRLSGNPIFPCVDDPHPGHPTLSSHEVVVGSILADRALGVVVHNSWIGHDVREFAGGGGLNCRPTGIFIKFGSPVYSDYEDNWIGGSMWVRHLHSCWFGALRNWVGTSMTISENRMGDPDAMEVVTNVVGRDLTCFRNQPAAQFGDSQGNPNRVGLHAFFECGFRVVLPNPAGQHKHFSHISVHLH